MTAIGLLDADPDIASRLDGGARAHARRVLLPVIRVASSSDMPTSLPRADGRAEEPVAMVLVLEGALLWEGWIGTRRAVQLHGPGDYVHALSAAATTVTLRRTRLSAYGSVTLAVVTRRVLTVAGRHPDVALELARRARGDGETARTYQAVAQLPRIEDRLVALFWHLAERFGHVTPRGVRLGLPLTHQLLGDLVGGRRPTVSLALTSLRAAGTLRHAGDGWYLHAGSDADLADSGTPSVRAAGMLRRRGHVDAPHTARSTADRPALDPRT